MLCLHPPALRNANGGPQGSHLNPTSNGASVPEQVPRMRTPPKFSIKAVHTAAQGSLLVESLLEPETTTLVVGTAECLVQTNKEYY